MSTVVRFGVSIDEELLRKFDGFRRERGFDTRSEALLGLIHGALTGDMGAKEHSVVAGTLTLVYDRHKSDLTRKLAAIQHDARHFVLAALHMHPDYNNCLEALSLRGKSGEERALAASILAVKSVKHGKFVLTATGREFA